MPIETVSPPVFPLVPEILGEPPNLFILRLAQLMRPLVRECHASEQYHSVLVDRRKRKIRVGPARGKPEAMENRNGSSNNFVNEPNGERRTRG
jgi:hypothetical protein